VVALQEKRAKPSQLAMPRVPASVRNEFLDFNEYAADTNFTDTAVTATLLSFSSRAAATQGYLAHFPYSCAACGLAQSEKPHGLDGIWKRNLH